MKKILFLMLLVTTSVINIFGRVCMPEGASCVRGGFIETCCPGLICLGEWGSSTCQKPKNLLLQNMGMTSQKRYGDKCQIGDECEGHPAIICCLGDSLQKDRNDRKCRPFLECLD